MTTANPFEAMNSGTPAPTLTRVKYRWKVPHLRYKAGDPFPESFGAGIRDTMIQHGRVEAVPTGEPAKSIDAPPADRMMRPRSVRTKAVEGRREGS